MDQTGLCVIFDGNCRGPQAREPWPATEPVVQQTQKPWNGAHDPVELAEERQPTLEDIRRTRHTCNTAQRSFGATLNAVDNSTDQIASTHITSPIPYAKSPRAKLCEHCDDIFALSGYYFGQEVRRLQYGLYSDICTSAKRGCSLCTVLVRSIRGCNLDGKIPRIYFAFEVVPDEDSGQEGGRGSGRLVSLWFSAVHSTSGDRVRRVPLFSCRLEAAQDVEKLVCTEEPQPNTGSLQSLTLAKRWLDQCLQKHNKYCPGNTTWKPKRLIDIGVDNRKRYPILVMTNDANIHGPYMTLSHRWGVGNPFKLTTQNIEQLKSWIDPSLLSKTFQDAIEVARFMEVRYLWIDSLCILQDCRDDWVTESAEMGQIYQNSHCNILAMTSEDGLFCDRDSSRLRSLKVDWGALGTKHGRQYYLTIQPSQSTLPLETRGWVLQEQLLAPRAVIFTKDQLFWQCCELEASETYPGGHPFLYGSDSARRIRTKLRNLPMIVLKRQLSNGRIRLFLGLFNLGFEHSGKLRYLDPPDESRAFLRDGEEKTPDVMIPPDPAWHYWANIVEEFTGRDLTNEDDRLTALSGVASVLAQRLPKELSARYLAGLWNRGIHDFFLRELLWQACGQTSPRPHNYRAPSWSWASVNGAVKYFMDGREIRRLAQVKKVSVQTANNHLVGAVRGGFVVMERPTLPGRSGEPSVFPDTNDSLPQLKDLVFFAVADCRRLGMDGTYGLVLEMLPDRNWRRIGLFKGSYDPEKVRRMPNQTLKIV